MRHVSKDNRRKYRTNNARNPCSLPFSTSNTSSVQSTDNAHRSSWAKWEDEISNILETDCSSLVQCDALNSDQDNNIYQISNKRSWKGKEYKQFPGSSGGDFVLKCSEKREKHNASLKNQGSQEKFKHKMKGIDYPRSSELSHLSMNTTPGNVVQNGATSHPNMAWDSNVLEDGYLKLGKYMDSASSNINIDKRKGIVIVEDDNFHDSRNIQAHSNRSSESITCRRHCSSNTPSPPCEEVINVSKQGTSCQLFNSRHKNAMEQKNYATHVDDIPKIAAYGSSNNANQRHKKFTIGKREQQLSKLCESSGLASENSETSHNQLSRLIPSGGWSSISSQINSFDCDRELDELPPPKLSLNSYPEQNILFDDDVANVSQIESDELLARQLQKQYNEQVAEAMSTNETEEPMSDLYAYYTQFPYRNSSARLSNRAQHQMSNARRNFPSSEIDLETRMITELRNFTRMDPGMTEEPMSDLYAYYTQLPYRNSSARLSNRAQHQMSNARRNFPSSEIDLETRMIAELRNFTRMDPGMRHDFLEALEAAFDQSNDSFDDFNDDGYEMLLTRDGKIGHAGASENQIDSLPQSTVQDGKVEENCAICLEVPSSGDKIRHLPCLHKFHTGCIDVWLRRKASCPVCKSKIS